LLPTARLGVKDSQEWVCLRTSNFLVGIAHRSTNAVVQRRVLCKQAIAGRCTWIGRLTPFVVKLFARGACTRSNFTVMNDAGPVS